MAKTASACYDEIRGGCGGAAGLVHPLGDARIVDIGEAVGGAAPDLGHVTDDLLGHGTPPPLPQARPQQQEETLRGK